MFLISSTRIGSETDISDMESNCLIRYFIFALFNQVREYKHLGIGFHSLLFKNNTDKVFNLSVDFEHNSIPYSCTIDNINQKTRLQNNKVIKNLFQQILQNNHNRVYDKEGDHIYQGRLFQNSIAYYDDESFSYKNLNFSKSQFNIASEASLMSGFQYENCLINKNKFLSTFVELERILLLWAENIWHKGKGNMNRYNEQYDKIYNLIQSLGNKFGYSLISINFESQLPQFKMDDELVDFDFTDINQRTFLIVLDTVMKNLRLSLTRNLDLNQMYPIIFIKETENLVLLEKINSIIPNCTIYVENK